ncbi:hypothetical protein BD626DRAFT_571269 [Schizophyllum amplum]|uniref:Uncharacterized protein n=1 Tax=Schizophyllum amplum TaxID=97359 RepID=A0A550C7X6_9AGAR|nr:hypothetical protein BD626DRAFT_571269 [Auriculariopsis ampla]
MPAAGWSMLLIWTNGTPDRSMLHSMWMANMLDFWESDDEDDIPGRLGVSVGVTLQLRPAPPTTPSRRADEGAAVTLIRLIKTYTDVYALTAS